MGLPFPTELPGTCGIGYARRTLAAEPSAGRRLTQSPSRVRLICNEQIEADLSQIVLVSDDGTTIRLITGADPRDVRALVAPVQLRAGSFRVACRVVSADATATR